MNKTVTYFVFWPTVNPSQQIFYLPLKYFQPILQILKTLELEEFQTF